MSENTNTNIGKKIVFNQSTIRAILPVIGLVVVFLLFTILTGGKLIGSLPLALSKVYVTMIASVGVFFIMTMGGLDFSQGSILGISSIVICALSKYNIPLAIIAGILTGALIGAINGYFYVFRKIKSFIVTICTMFLLRGIIKYLTSDAPVAASMDFINLDSTALKLTVTVVVLAIGFIVFTYTKFGTYLKAIGAGEKAAMFAGIKTDKMKFWIYVLAGAITGLAAFISTVKIGSVTSSGGNQLETQILIALVLGGMPISGGAKVRFINVIVGSILYTILESGLIMIGLTTQSMQLVEGIVFLVFVAIFADRQSLQVIK
ncbi:MAG: ABC transporter permease [Lachnospiraceae bacterium]|nr:ABC transporter permease [Lachnospiraceae bacterium]